MTCVVGLVKGGKVYLGSDSSAVDEKGGHIFAQKNPKQSMGLLAFIRQAVTFEQ
jgi:hypothetical protein